MNHECLTLGQTILAALKAKGLTQADLARKMGKTRSTIHAWCRDKTKPRLDTLSQIASTLDTTVAELMAGRWRKTRAAPMRHAA
jgi:transcriptional regulator with XRE-family HTH domain